MKKRSWSQEEKLKILKEVEKEGLQITLRKHGIYPATYYGWKKKLVLEGESGLSDTAQRQREHKYIKQLEDELYLAKQLLAEREMEIALQDELLKKKYPRARKKK